MEYRELLLITERLNLLLRVIQSDNGRIKQLSKSPRLGPTLQLDVPTVPSISPFCSFHHSYRYLYNACVLHMISASARANAMSIIFTV